MTKDFLTLKSDWSFENAGINSKYGLNTAKALLAYHCGCHGNLVTVATRYVVDAHCLKEPPYSILLMTKELLMYHCGCHGNLVTIAMRYVADAYRPKAGFYLLGGWGKLLPQKSLS